MRLEGPWMAIAPQRAVLFYISFPSPVPDRRPPTTSSRCPVVIVGLAFLLRPKSPKTCVCNLLDYPISSQASEPGNTVEEWLVISYLVAHGVIVIIIISRNPQFDIVTHACKCSTRALYMVDLWLAVGSRFWARNDAILRKRIPPKWGTDPFRARRVCTAQSFPGGPTRPTSLDESGIPGEIE